MKNSMEIIRLKPDLIVFIDIYDEMINGFNAY